MEKYNEILKLFKVETPVGFSIEDVENAKAEVGGLPLELERFYIYCGNSPELHGLQDELILPNRYQALLNPDYIVFFNENQGVCQAAVKKSDISLPDPPVYTTTDDGEWVPSAPRVSDFLCAMFDYQASICLECNPEDFFWITPKDKALVEQSFPKLGEFDNWIYDWHVTTYGEGGGRIALMENGGEIQASYAANNESDFERINNMFGKMWEPV